MAAAMEQLKENLHIIKPQKSSRQSETERDRTNSGSQTGVGPAEKRLLSQAAPESSADAARRPARRISRAQLINKLNYLNFINGSIVVNFKHPAYGETSSLHAYPLPCLGNRLDCRWVEGINTHIFQTHQFDSLLLTKNQQMIKIVPEILSVDKKGFCVNLPEFAEEVSDRCVQRHYCDDITAQLIQNRSVFSGRLIDFNARSFKISLTLDPPQSFSWIDPQQPLTVIFTSRQRTLYSGECRIIRSTRGLQQRHYILAPLQEEIQRYRKTEYRSPRHQLRPSPNLIFNHPLTGKRVDLKICDLSGSGFSVEEDESNALLLPGLILPSELTAASRWFSESQRRVNAAAGSVAA